jgi:hypothetical protein
MQPDKAAAHDQGSRLWHLGVPVTIAFAAHFRSTYTCCVLGVGQLGLVWGDLEAAQHPEGVLLGLLVAVQNDLLLLAGVHCVQFCTAVHHCEIGFRMSGAVLHLSFLATKSLSSAPQEWQHLKSMQLGTVVSQTTAMFRLQGPSHVSVPWG